MMERTSICLDKPLLDRIKTKAHKEQKTLKDTIAELIKLGLAKAEKNKLPHPEIKTFDLGNELVDISSRSRLYENWEKES